MNVLHYNTYSAYKESDERAQISPFNVYYLDNLYFVSLYQGMQEIDNDSFQPMIISNMAATAYQTGLFCTAYGLHAKLLTIENDLPDINEFHHWLSRDLSIFSQSHSCIADFINKCTSLNLFEFMWVLSDLETSIPDYSCMCGYQKNLRDLWHPHLSTLESELHM